MDTIKYLPTPALSDSVLRALGRGQELTLGEIVRQVRNDYGNVSERSVSRYLSAMARHGDVVRDGAPTAFVYRKSR